MQFWALTVDSFRESRDRKIFWVMLAITLLVAAGMACFSFEPNRVNILFGTWQVDTDLFTVGGAVRRDFIASIIIDYVMDLVLGWIGIILVLVATAGFLPSMLEHGSIQVLLSKPMPRWMLLLSKYVGSLVFIFTQAAIFVILTFLVAGLRWNVWLPGYLLAIPLITILFSYLYCVSALVAVLTKSTIAAIMVSLGAWVFFFAIQSAHDSFRIFPAMQEYTRVETVVSGLRWVTPKTQDITYIARKWARAASPMDLMPPPESEEDQQWVERAGNVETARMRVPAYQTIGSSLLFELAILAIAAWKFSRQDY